MLESYQRHLFHYRKTNGEPLRFRSQSQRLLAVRAFFKWAATSATCCTTPPSQMELPRPSAGCPGPP